MKKFISFFLIFFLYQVIASAAEALLFIEIPDNVTNDEALYDIRHAAINRKWKVIDTKNGKLKISLNHRGYQAVLEFYVSNGRVKYIDTSKYRTITKNWVYNTAPNDWIENLKRDTNKFFYQRFLKKNNSLSNDCVTTLTLEEAEKRLDGLKSLYSKGLITEEDYKKKKEDILSKY